MHARTLVEQACAKILNQAVYLVRYVRFIFYCLRSSVLDTSKNTHLAYNLSQSESENLFRDSGYWDFLILSLYDYYFRLFFVYSLLVVSDYSIGERASWRGAGYLLRPSNLVLFTDLKTLFEVLQYLFSCLLFLALLVLFLTMVGQCFF
jgi:hypothetical protein